eukprot:5500320-Alexandrium_andersonii.AAC.1
MKLQLMGSISNSNGMTLKPPMRKEVVTYTRSEHVSWKGITDGTFDLFTGSAMGIRAHDSS